MLGRERQASDFRTITTLRLSEAPRLEEVKESGEVSYGSRGEEAEAFSLKTFARIFSLSRTAIVNDDLGAFADALNSFARAAAETQATQLVSLLTANSGNGASLADGNPLFTTARGNKAASGSPLGVSELAAGRQALRQTKGLDGVTPLNLLPAYLLVSPDRETGGEVILTQILAAQVADVNPFGGKLKLLVEPRLAGNSWRLFSEPSKAPVISYAYLNGKRGPTLETRAGWSTLGTEFRAVLDFGCAITDWRGAYLDPGEP